jgi:predicted outer membrane protein
MAHNLAGHIVLILIDQIMKTKMKIFAPLIVLVCIVSCRQKEDTQQIIETYNIRQSEELELKRNAEFLSYASEFNLLEIKLAQLAYQNSIDPKTKNLVKNFETLHRRLYNESKSLANKKKLPVKSSLSINENETYKKMSYEIADDFEKQYFDKILSDYEYAIERFEKISATTTDGDIKRWSKSTIPLLRKNLGIIIISDAEINNKKHLN